jgi:hypothetical protein
MLQIASGTTEMLKLTEAYSGFTMDGIIGDRNTAAQQILHAHWQASESQVESKLWLLQSFFGSQ